MSEREGQFGQFLEVARCDVFWDRVHLAVWLVTPLSRFSSWLKGCDCHEEERKRGQVVSCAWQGCRARSLSDRLQQTVEELRDHRHGRHGGERGWGDELSTRMLHSLKAKFAWVDEAPALLWQAWDRAQARRLLEERDAGQQAEATPGDGAVLCTRYVEARQPRGLCGRPAHEPRVTRASHGVCSREGG